jgi:hypothetical protein
MSRHQIRQRISRREFLGATAVTAAAGVAFVATRPQAQPAPFATASGFAAAQPAAAPASVLVVRNPTLHPDFGAYLSEMLRTEGVLGVQEIGLAQLDREQLAAVQVVLLGAGRLSADTRTLLTEYVAAGGALLGLRADAALADLFGVQFSNATANGDYLRVETGSPLQVAGGAAGFQLHVPYQRVQPAGAQVLATSANGDPLVTMHRFGTGATAFWAFDLAQHIALMRQGNPALADQEHDLMEGVRASDLFVNWIDLERIAIPQADQMQRLFVGLIELLGTQGAPLPRLWYFPAGAAAVLVATGDAHGSRVSHIEQLLGAVEQHGGTASIYYTPPAAGTLEQFTRRSRWRLAELPGIGGRLAGSDPLPSPQQVAAWRARGHEFGMHPYVEAGLEAGYNAYWNEFIGYGYGPLPPTVRTHRILWHGWVENARVQAQYGLRMNLDHYHSGPVVRRTDGTWTRGYLNGSGLPMRFVSEAGVLLSVYQQPTHLVDEHLMDVFSTGFEVGLDGDAAAAVTIAQIAESVAQYPAALGLQCHIDPFLFGGATAERVGRWLEQTLAYAAAQQVPILSAERWLAFTEARHATQILAQRWDRTTRRLDLELQVPAQPTGSMILLLPEVHAGATLRQINATATTDVRQQIAGRNYQSVALSAGRQVISAWYG